MLLKTIVSYMLMIARSYPCSLTRPVPSHFKVIWTKYRIGQEIGSLDWMGANARSCILVRGILVVSTLLKTCPHWRLGFWEQQTYKFHATYTNIRRIWNLHHNPDDHSMRVSYYNCVSKYCIGGKDDKCLAKKLLKRCEQTNLNHIFEVIYRFQFN